MEQQHEDLRLKLEDAMAKAGPGQAVDISDILNRHIRRVAAPKTDKGAKKVVDGTNLISNNYDAVEFASKLLGRRELATNFGRTFGKGGLTRTPGQVKETRGRSLIDAVADAERNGKLVDVSGLEIVRHGTGDKAYDKVQGYRTVDASKFSGNYGGNKKQIPGVAIISNNYDAYALAAEELGVGYAAQQFYDQFPNLRGGKPAKRSPRAKAERVAKSPGRGASAQERLAFMYDKAASQGANLDVSNLNADGTGSKIVKKSANPKGQVTRLGAGGEQILISNNYQGYALATDLLGPEFAQFAEAYRREHGAGKQQRPAPKPKKSPGTKRQTGRIEYQRSASRSPSRSASRSPVRTTSQSSTRGRSSSPSALSRRLSQEREVEGALERSLARARSASRSASRSPTRGATRSPTRAASPVRTAPRIPVPRRTGQTQANVQI